MYIRFILLFTIISNHCLAQEVNRPNIIFILTDDQRWDAIGHAGNDFIETPHMDSMARQSTYYNHAFVTTPICAASRASIITGMYERTHGYTFGTSPLSTSYIDISYPVLLKSSGYKTGFFGKLGMNMEDRRDTTLFDTSWTARTDGYFRLQGPGSKEHIHLTDLTTDKAIDFIQDQRSGTPFCISISYNAPHADDASPQQYFWPARHDSLYNGTKIPGPNLGEEKYFESLPDFVKDSTTISRMRWHWRYDTPDKYQRMVKGYYRMITTIDDNLGRLRRVINEKGIAQNTIIIWMGDNGYFLGERRLAGKWLMYDNSLRVPLMIYDPNQHAESNNELALNIDIAPTILDYAMIDIPSQMQGKSLKKKRSNPQENTREEFFCEHLFNNPYIPKSEGIRTTKWKYFRYIDHPEVEELYDLENDPNEIDDLSKDLKYRNLLNFFRTKTDKKIKALLAAKIN